MDKKCQYSNLIIYSINSSIDLINNVNIAPVAINILRLNIPLARVGESAPAPYWRFPVIFVFELSNILPKYILTLFLA